MFLLIDAFGLFLAVTLAFAVWGPDVYRWIAYRLGIRPPVERSPSHFGLE